VSNYRVRQVLALGEMPRRQLRFLVALATYLGDDSLSVRLSFRELNAAAGLSERWMKITRAELREGKRIEYEPGRYRGNRTLWTMLCLPEKGAPIGSALPGPQKGAPMSAPFAFRKGAPDSPGRGHLNSPEGGTPESADQQQPERRLNPLAKSSGSLSSVDRAAHQLLELGGSEREIRFVISKITKDSKIRYPGAYLRKAIEQGDGPELLAAARQVLCPAGTMHDQPRVPPSAEQQVPPSALPRPAGSNGHQFSDPVKVASIIAETRRHLRGSGGREAAS